MEVYFLGAKGEGVPGQGTEWLEEVVCAERVFGIWWGCWMDVRYECDGVLCPKYFISQFDDGLDVGDEEAVGLPLDVFVGWRGEYLMFHPQELFVESDAGGDGADGQDEVVECFDYDLGRHDFITDCWYCESNKGGYAFLFDMRFEDGGVWDYICVKGGHG